MLHKLSIHRMRLVGVIIFAVLGLMLFVLVSQPGFAQHPDPNGEGEVNTPQTEDADAPSAFVIQGKLTDSSGAPLNGNYTITYRVYSTSTGGTALCSDTNTVTISNGLFTDVVSCTASAINGGLLYLGIQVGSDAEMTPRRIIYPVPYAMSLRPGAVISSTVDTVLTVRSTGSGDNDAFTAYASSSGEAIEAFSTDGVAIFANSDNYLALQAYSYVGSTEEYPAIFGCVGANNSTCDPYRDDGNAGVMGYSQYGFGGQFKGADGGLLSEGNGALSPGAWVKNSSGVGALIQNSFTATGNATLYLVQGNSGGEFVVGADSYLGTRVDRTGKGFFNGGTQSSGADFAEQMAVQGEKAEYEPGDVLVISTSRDRTVELSSQPFATTVIGVYSTQPAVLAGAPDTDDPLDGIPVAITGIVPCKVSAENGAIRRGDLLVTSSIPGHAMRAGDYPPQGTVLGKALGELSSGTGVIYILVVLQ